MTQGQNQPDPAVRKWLDGESFDMRNPNLPVPPDNRPWYKKKRFLIPIGIVALFIFAGLLGDPDPTSTPTAIPVTSDAPATTDVPATTEEVTTTEAPAITAAPAKPKWRTIHTLSGSGPKKGPIFELRGERGRIKYTYSGGGAAGLFSFYIVEEGVNLAEAGGFPEVMESQGSGSDTTELSVGPGRYYIQTNTANVQWKVTVQDYR